MYKVFIDNIPNEFHFDKEQTLLEEFEDHKFIRAAGGIVRGAEGFLFIKRHGLWDIPKGKLDKGEPPTAGAIREVEEECGVEGPAIISHLCDTWHTYEHKGKKMLKKTYWYAMILDKEGQNLVPQTEEGISEVKFFGRDDFDFIKEDTYLSIVEVIERLEQLLDA